MLQWSTGNIILVYTTVVFSMWTGILIHSQQRQLTRKTSSLLNSEIITTLRMRLWTQASWWVLWIDFCSFLTKISLWGRCTGRCLRSWRYVLLLQRIWTQFPAFMLVSSQPPAIPALENSSTSVFHRYMHKHTHIQKNKKKNIFKVPLWNCLYNKETFQHMQL